MNKNAIIKTAVTYWDDEDKCFITESPLADTICGCGDTAEESYNAFIVHVDGNYNACKTGRHAIYAHPGRPKKGNIRFTVEIKPDIKEALALIAKDFNISQGEAVEYVYSFWKAYRQNQQQRGNN